MINEVTNKTQDKLITRNGTEEPDEDLKQIIKYVREQQGDISIIDARAANPSITWIGKLSYDKDGKPVVPGEDIGLILAKTPTPRAIYVIEPEMPDPKAESRPVIDAGKTGSVYGDPYFLGFEGKGEHFWVSGEAGKTYNLLSDRDVQVNGQFIRSPGAITWLGNVGIKVRNNKIQFNVNGAPPSVNSQNLKPGDVIRLNKQETVSWDGNVLVVTTREYTFRVSTHDLRVAVGKEGVFKYDGVMPHGLLGQTADADDQARIGHDYQGTDAIEGNYKSYEVPDLFSDSFSFNHYTKRNPDLTLPT